MDEGRNTAPDLPRESWTEARGALAGRLEPFLIERLEPGRQDFPAGKILPRLTWNRLDLAIKLAFLEGRTGVRSDFADKLYAAHIHAFSLGEMVEPGNEGKAGIDRFMKDFNALYADLEANGFDAGRSLIPLARDGSILNGAHRAACAMHLAQPVAAVETGLEPFIYDDRYFRKRGMSAEDLDAAAILYAEAAPQARIALLWPAAGGSQPATEALLGGIACRKDIRLGAQGAHNLMAEVYSGEPWLGAPGEDFPGIRNKLVPCFAGSKPLRVFLFDAGKGRDLVAVKDEIRDIHKIAKHSIHITDTHEEAVRLARILFNPQSLHFLENARPNAFPQTRAQMRAFSELLAGQGIDPQTAVIDSGMVMAAYGLRPAEDVDFICASDVRCADPFEQHDGARYPHGVGDLLRNPANHFHFGGLKFISLDLVAGMKKTRLAGRDREDLARIGPLLDRGRKTAWHRSLIYAARFRIARARHVAIRALKAVGLFNAAKWLYDRVRR